MRNVENVIDWILEEEPPLPASPRSIETASGAAARVSLRQGREHLELVDPAGRLLFSYDTETGRGTLCVPRELELCAGGDLVLRSGRRVRMEGERGVDLRGEELRVRADRGEFRVRDARWWGSSLESALDRAVLSVRKLETLAERVIERATNVYRHVQKLHQLKAGRTRTLVAGSHHLKAKTVSMRAEGLARLDGDQVHLG